MSTRKFIPSRRLIYSIVITAVFVVVLSGFLKHLFLSFRLSREINERQKELSLIKEANLAMKMRLEEVNRKGFVDERTRELLGLLKESRGAVSTEPSSPEPDILPLERDNKGNFQKWLNLILH